MTKFSPSSDIDIEAITDYDSTTAFSGYTIDDGDEHKSDAIDVSGYKHLAVLAKFENFVGTGPDQVRVTIYTGDSTDHGENTYWDVTNISADDVITLPLEDEVSETSLKVSIENKDGSPTSNYCDVTVKVFSKS